MGEAQPRAAGGTFLRTRPKTATEILHAGELRHNQQLFLIEPPLPLEELNQIVVSTSKQEITQAGLTPSAWWLKNSARWNGLTSWLIAIVAHDEAVVSDIRVAWDRWSPPCEGDAKASWRPDFEKLEQQLVRRDGQLRQRAYMEMLEARRAEWPARHIAETEERAKEAQAKADEAWAEVDAVKALYAKPKEPVAA